MEQRRFLLFLTLSLLIWVGWMNFVMPKFFPQPPKPAKKPANNAAAQLHADDAPADALRVANAAVDQPKAVKVEQPGVPNHPPETVKLGSLDLESEFFMEVELTSRGAAVKAIRLNDYPTFKERDQPLEVVGSDFKPGDPLTFATPIKALDDQLPLGVNNAELNWELIPDSVTDRTAAFRLVAPDGTLEAIKRYELKQLPAADLAQPKARHRLFEGYNLYLTIELHNRDNAAADVEYTLQGPVGTPLEDADNSSKWRDIRMAFFSKNGQVERQQMTATDVVDKTEDVDKDGNNKIETWSAPLKYLGVDVKYFAALVEPLGNQIQNQTVITSRAQLVEKNKDEKSSDISVLLEAKPKIPAGGEVKHEYRLFAGPKRQELLAGTQAEEIVDFGYVTPIAKGMLWMLNFFHDYLHVNYGIAIILLTVVVRLAMMPVSLHQAHNMQRMKELQPKIKELQAKHKDQKEELARAQMELFRKHNYNPLSGCLPLFLQLPIFIGLYTALSGAVDLRMAKFLWIDNLASPDALFPLGFTVPWFDWTDFNLLPIISTALMFFQQKMMMPPPADEEQAMQQKMMNYMMIFMGAMFYRVPAGLCLYFIASSVWGMVERWVINKISKKNENPTPAPVAADVSAPAPAPAANETAPNPGSRFGEMWNKLQQAADKDTSITRTSPNGNGHAKGGKKKKR